MKASWEPKNGLSRSSHEDENGFAMRLALCAKRYGSATALAKKAGMSQSTLHRYSRGSEPNRAHLVAIARAAGVSLEWLATGEGSSEEEAATKTDVNLDLLEEVVSATREILKRRRIDLKPSAEGRLIRVLYWHFASRTEHPDEDTVSNIIDLASYR